MGPISVSCYEDIYFLCYKKEDTNAKVEAYRVHHLEALNTLRGRLIAAHWDRTDMTCPLHYCHVLIDNNRITEMAGVVLPLDPKPIESMREEGGYEAIKKAILNLSLRHKEHIIAYGEGNEQRLTGKHETASVDTSSWKNRYPFPKLPIEGCAWEDIKGERRLGSLEISEAASSAAMEVTATSSAAPFDAAT
ncbi:Glutamine synthetase [Nymphaea thermarum]|nr:Glutamine synthetase [Nymphaea thermarum]